ncbi:MAG: tyrosine-type recombinase/integrase [Desulfovibrio sp.]
MAVTKYKTKAGIRYNAQLYLNGRVVASKRGFPKKKEAQTWLTQEHLRFTQPDQATPTGFSEIANLYLTYSKNQHSPNTHGYKRRTCSRLIQYIHQHFSISDEVKTLLFFFVDVLTPSVCDAYMLFLKKNHSAKTANRELRELSTVFTWAVRKGLIAKNPFASCDKFPEKEFIRAIPTLDTVKAVRAVCSLEERDLFDFILYTAARPISLFRLKWEDVDFSRNSVRLWIQKRKGGNMESYQLTMPSALREMLKNRAAVSINEFVFHNSEGRPLHKSSAIYLNLFKGLCKKANVEHFTANGLRSFIASLADSSGANLRDIQRQFGHKRQSTTEQYIDRIKVADGVVSTLEDLSSQLL